MSDSPALDRVIWSALTTRHADLAEGDALARRYHPDIVPFAASADDRPESLAALAKLGAAGAPMMLLQADSIHLPEGLTVGRSGEGVQMVAERPFPTLDDPKITPLGPADAADMLALAELTKPGPFSLKAQALGSFWGLRDGAGGLIAMGGERFKVPGMTELSGLCTHPDHQGRGLGRRLLAHVAGQISARGEGVFLHAYAWNEKAIALYEAMGFRLRCRVNAALVVRSEG